jgi:restriction system protein
MSLWVVRAGRYGEQEETALKDHLVCHGWNELPDYSHCQTKEELRELYQHTFPSQSQMRAAIGLGQVWRFAREIQKGDLVALPLKTSFAFAFGRVTGDYQYKKVAPNVMHIRKVEWIKTIPRSAFPEQILFSMNAALTVFNVYRNEAENHVKKLLSMDATDLEVVTENAEEEPEVLIEDGPSNLEQNGRDEIVKYIQANFKSHDLARLIDAVLKAQGYKTKISLPGPDGGVDILAGSGPHGFDLPRLCVQVKSGGRAADQKVFNELRGVMSKFTSDHGLLVSWGGFTKPMSQDARNDFFKVRLWDQGDIVNAVLTNYDQLDAEIKAELPLKRIWVLAKDEVE